MKNLFLIFLLFFTVSTNAESFVLLNKDTHSIVYSSNPNEVKPIASLTKLMTAMIYIDSGEYKESYLERLLIRSDNEIANRIAKEYKYGYKAFMRAMNAKAEDLGLAETYFFDPSGMSVFNRSTAKEYVEVVVEAEKYPLIKQISSTYEKKVEAGKKQTTVLRNTNSLLRYYDNITLSKTGFTSRAGRCLALIIERGSSQYAIVILGEKNPIERTKTVVNLLNFINQE